MLLIRVQFPCWKVKFGKEMGRLGGTVAALTSGGNTSAEEYTKGTAQHLKQRTGKLALSLFGVVKPSKIRVQERQILARLSGSASSVK